MNTQSREVKAPRTRGLLRVFSGFGATEFSEGECAITRKIEARNILKIFGDAPEEAERLLEGGASKDEILRKTGQTVGVQDVSFDVEEGEIFVVMGLSGSGKSTLVRILNRLIPATRGEVRIDGEDVLAVDAERLRRIRLEKIAMVFQHFALFPHKTVLENTEYGLKVQGVDAAARREKAMAALEQVGLSDWAHRRPDALSGGMQQRVGLARSLAVDPEILLMDEPFSALDPLIRRDMQNELLQLQKQVKKTIVFITHDLHEALILGDRIAIMKEGRFVQVGTAEDIVGDPADDYVAAFTQDIDRARVFSIDRVMSEPRMVNLEKEDVDSAIERLGEAGTDAMHAAENGRIVGILTQGALANASRRGDVALRDLVETDYPRAVPGTHLYKLYKSCASGLPVAVMEDGTDTLLGVVTPEAVFEQLTTDDGTATDGTATDGTATDGGGDERDAETSAGSGAKRSKKRSVAAAE